MKNVKFYISTLILALIGIGLGFLLYPKGATAVGGSTLAGKVIFEGAAPSPTPIRMDADPACMLQNKDGGTAEDVIVNSNGTLKNVFVYVKQGLEGQKFDPPTEPVVLDQKGCRYQPHVFGIMVNQPVQIINSDGTLHNVHAVPKNNKEFNLGMPIQGMKLAQKFALPEVMVKIKCEVHPWMAAYGGVLDHPFYAVTGDDGTFFIKDLPPGEYTLEAWHEKYGTQTATIKVPDTTEASFTFKG